MITVVPLSEGRAPVLGEELIRVMREHVREGRERDATKEKAESGASEGGGRRSSLSRSIKVSVGRQLPNTHTRN